MSKIIIFKTDSFSRNDDSTEKVLIEDKISLEERISLSGRIFSTFIEYILSQTVFSTLFVKIFFVCDIHARAPNVS